jgi:hypothetical protein
MTNFTDIELPSSCRYSASMDQALSSSFGTCLLFERDAGRRISVAIHDMSDF